MKSTLEKILQLPEPEWQWDPENSIYTDFTPAEENQLIAIIKNEHLIGKHGDEISDAEDNAQIHAYRILSTFLNPIHIPLFIEWAFLREFEYSGMLTEDFIAILPRYKTAVIEPCVAELNNQENSEEVRMMLCDVLNKLASNEANKDHIVSIFCSYLSAKHFTRRLNAHIICFLIELELPEKIDIIRDCYADHLVDLSFAGDLEEVEVELGIREERSTPRIDLHEEEEKELHLALKKSLGPEPPESKFAELFYYILELYGRDCSMNNPIAIDGYLTAILLSPTTITPSQFLPKIWDLEEEYSPVWENKNHLSSFMVTLMAIYNKISDSLQNQILKPITDVHEDDPKAPLYSVWLCGFLNGFYAWDPSLDYEDQIVTEHEGLVLSLVFKILIEEIKAGCNNSQPDTAAIKEELFQAIYNLFYENKSKNLSLHRHNPHTAEPKTSRNSPCPCGSGKKYKRCCMN
jgi:yecA family protein